MFVELSPKEGIIEDDEGAKNAGGSGGGIPRWLDSTSSSNRFRRLRFLTGCQGEDGGETTSFAFGTRIGSGVEGGMVEGGSEGGSWELMLGGKGRMSEVGAGKVGCVSGISIIQAGLVSF
jgi:hypothetical protein